MAFFNHSKRHKKRDLSTASHEAEESAISNRNRPRGVVARATPKPKRPWWQAVLHGLRWMCGLTTLTSILLGLCYVGLWITRPDALPLQYVQIEGKREHWSNEAAQTFFKDYMNSNFLQINLVALRSLLQDEPWLADVAVERKWPNTLIVQVTERQPYARWGEKGLVDRNGLYFQPSEITKEIDWVQLDGPKGYEQEVIQTFEEIRRRVGPLGLGVRKLKLDSRHAWWVTLNNGIQLALGRNELGQRLDTFIQNYPETLALHASEIRTVDLRYSNGFAVRWWKVSLGDLTDSIAWRANSNTAKDTE